MLVLFWGALALILYVYAGYPLLLWGLGMVKCRYAPPASTVTPRLSLIISAYNEEGVIRAKILNSLGLVYPPELLEIIIASDGSTDRTTAIAAEYASQGVKVCDFPVRRGKNGTLNAVVPQANGDIIVFTDANGKFQKDALHKLVRHFADPRVGCVCGELLYVSADDNLVARGYDVYWRFDQQLKRFESRLACLLGANGSIFAIRRELYQTLPGDVCNDMVLGILIAARGYHVIYDPEAISLEAGSHNAQEELERRSRIIGRGLLGVRKVLPAVLRGKRMLLLWELVSRKFLRYCTPFFFLMFAVANGFLWNGIYAWTLAAQGLFYGAVLVSFVLRRLGFHLRLLSVPHYFVLGNLAALLGWVKACFGRDLAKWETVERTYDTRIPSDAEIPSELLRR
jgi:cellulose synthase/poly-beta-1,6-N-acetylglucosamine synthase-like glycosyltransferase